MKVKDFLAVHAAHVASGEALNRATAKILPLGTTVLLQMGNAIIEGEIVSTSDYALYQPDGITLRNTKTGKFRHTTARYAFKSCGMEILNAGGAS